MNFSKKRITSTVNTLQDLGVIDKKKESYHVTPDFDLVVRGLLIKRLKRISGEGSRQQLKQAETEALVDALSTYGFLNITQKQTDVELAVNCLLTFRKEDLKKNE